jgi:hypothetical protein
MPSTKRRRFSDAVGGPLPGIDISDSAALQKMEDSEYVERMSHVNDAAGRQRHWDIFSRLLGETETPGPRVSDARYAALAIG